MKLVWLVVLAAVSVAGCVQGNVVQDAALADLTHVNLTLLNVHPDPENGLLAYRAYVFQGVGASMEPAMHAGQYYLCFAQRAYGTGDVVVYKGSLELVPNPTPEEIAQGYKLVAHRIIRIENGLFKIKGDNNFPVDTARLERIICRVMV